MTFSLPALTCQLLVTDVISVLRSGGYISSPHKLKLSRSGRMFTYSAQLLFPASTARLRFNTYGVSSSVRAASSFEFRLTINLMRAARRAVREERPDLVVGRRPRPSGRLNFLPVGDATLLDPDFHRWALQTQQRALVHAIHHAHRIANEVVQEALRQLPASSKSLLLGSKDLLQLAARLARVEAALDLPVPDGFRATDLLPAARRYLPDMQRYEDPGIDGFRGRLAKKRGLRRLAVYMKAEGLLRLEYRLRKNGIMAHLDRRPGLSSAAIKCLILVPRVLYRSAYDRARAVRRVTRRWEHLFDNILTPIRLECAQLVAPILGHLHGASGKLCMRLVRAAMTLNRPSIKRVLRLIRLLRRGPLHRGQVDGRHERLLRKMTELGLLVQPAPGSWAAPAPVGSC